MHRRHPRRQHPGPAASHAWQPNNCYIFRSVCTWEVSLRLQGPEWYVSEKESDRLLLFDL